MKRTAKVAFVATLAALLTLVLGLGALAATDTTLHKNSTTTATGICVACHGNVATSKSLSPSTVVTAHKLHMRSPQRLARFVMCTTCHKSTDKINDSGANLRKQVASQMCLACHGQFRTTGVSQHTGYTVASNCLAAGCHNSRAEVRADHRADHAPVTAKAARAQYCADCHGGSTSVPAFLSAEETDTTIW